MWMDNFIHSSDKSVCAHNIKDEIDRAIQIVDSLRNPEYGIGFLIRVLDQWL